MNNSWRRAVLRAATCGAIGIVLVPGGYRVRAQETEDAAAKEAVKSAAEIRARYTKYEFRIPMRDGAKLFTAVYVPKDAAPSKAYPFLIERTPYSVGPYGADNYPKRLGPARSFVADAQKAAAARVKLRSSATTALPTRTRCSAT